MHNKVPFEDKHNLKTAEELSFNSSSVVDYKKLMAIVAELLTNEHC